MDFTTLLGADEWGDLREAFWEKRSVVRASNVTPARFESLWAEWQVEALCRFTPAPSDHERFRLISRAKRVSPSTYFDRMGVFREEAFRQLRAGGASLALGSFENYSNLSLAITRWFEAEFSCPVQVNLYVTPGERQGLGAHVDPHDVLILQIQGEKSWDIYDPLVKSDSTGGSGALESSADGSLFRRVTLKQGGWLFLPKGTRHEVRNRAGEPSVHFTIGFHPLTWGEVFQRALNRARVSGLSMNEALLPGVEMPGAAVSMETRLGTILPWVNVAEQVAAYYADFPLMGVPVPESHVLSLAGLDAVGPTTVFHWREDAGFTGQAAGRRCGLFGWKHGRSGGDAAVSPGSSQAETGVGGQLETDGATPHVYAG